MNLKKASLILIAALLLCAVPFLQVMPVSAATADEPEWQEETLQFPPPNPPYPPTPPVPPVPPVTPVVVTPVIPVVNCNYYPQNCCPDPCYPSCDPCAPSCNYDRCDPCYPYDPCDPCDRCTTTVVVVEECCKPKVCEPVINSFTSYPACVEYCEKVTLKWSVSNADTVNISPDIGNVSSSGTRSINVFSTTTYTLTASNSAGSVSASTKVTVVQPYTSTSSSYQSGIVNSAGAATSGTGGITTMGFGGNNSWLIVVLIGMLSVATAAIVIMSRRKSSLAYAGNTAGAGYLHCATATYEETRTSRTAAAATEYSARFLVEGGGVIPLPVNGRNLGRDDFKPFSIPGKIEMISREHVRIDCQDNSYYIEDRSSTNGTRLNGTKINGKGRIQLNDGDVVELADAVTLTFRS